MNRTCPRCGHEISRWMYIGFSRLLSIQCPRCHALLTLDPRGRATFWWLVLGSVVVTAIVAGVGAASLAAVLLVVGIVIAVLATANVGHLVIAPDSEGGGPSADRPPSDHQGGGHRE